MELGDEMGVELHAVGHGREVIVRGRRVPMLEAYPTDGGKVNLVFDHRLGLALTAENYEQVIAFVADVMENVMHPECGRTFNRVVEIGAVGADGEDD
jgi:hypothetical protein